MSYRDVVGYVDTENGGPIVCAECVESNRNGIVDDSPDSAFDDFADDAWAAIFTWDEWDWAPGCELCFEILPVNCLHTDQAPGLGGRFPCCGDRDENICDEVVELMGSLYEDIRRRPGISIDRLLAQHDFDMNVCAAVQHLYDAYLITDVGLLGYRAF